MTTLGPNLQKWLSSYPSILSKKNLSTEDKLLMLIQTENSVKDQSSLEDFVDELVSMKLPLLALKLVDLYEHTLWKRDHFRSLHTEGIAAILAGEIERAEDLFYRAQQANPKEPATYVNLVQILSQEQRFQELPQWIEAGLEIDPNYSKMWETIISVFAQEKEKIWDYVHRFPSWVGHCAWIGIQDEDDTLKNEKQLSLLEEYYGKGERSDEFLVEYTGFLGQNGSFEKILPVVWQAKHTSQKIPWRLTIHGLQAQMALGHNQAAETEIEGFLKDQKTPEQIKQYLTQMKEVIQS